MTRFFALLFSLSLLVGCAQDSLVEKPVPMGDFSLGHNVIVASKMQKGPISRKATEAEWTQAMTKAIADRFGRYDGENLYHLGISVEGYMLAPPGVPVVYSPKSALIINVTVWDDKAGKKYNDKPHQMTVFEDTTGESLIIGSGLGRTKEEQIEGLSSNAAYLIQVWLEKMHEKNGWFTDEAIYNPVEEEAPQARL
jgi:hypothetical protein